MAEKEQRSRLDNDKMILDNQHAQHKRDTDTFRIGQMLAMLSVFSVIGLCVWCFKLGYHTEAATIATASIVGVITAFTVRGRKSK